MMKIVLAIAIVAAGAFLAWAMIQRGHYITPFLLFFFSIWCAASLMHTTDKPLSQSYIQITKNAADKAEKETP